MIKGTSGILMLPEAKTQPQKAHQLQSLRALRVSLSHAPAVPSAPTPGRGTWARPRKLGVLNCLEVRLLRL